MMEVWSDCDQPEAPYEPEEPQPRTRESCMWATCGERWCSTCWPELHEEIECAECGESSKVGAIWENGGDCPRCNKKWRKE